MTALGPSSSLSKPWSLPPSTARRARVFFTTVIRRPFSRRRRRMPWFLSASIPRGLITATPSSSFSRVVSSFVIRSLTCLLMGKPLSVASCQLPVVGGSATGNLRNRQLNGRRHRGLDHDFLKVRALAGLRLYLAD